MKIFEQLERTRGWDTEEQAVLDAVRRVAVDVIAPKAAEYDKSGEFPWDSVKAAYINTRRQSGRRIAEFQGNQFMLADLAMRMTTEAVQMHGGYGYIRDYRVERLMRDAKITQIWEGTNQVHRQLIGRSFVGK